MPLSAAGGGAGGLSAGRAGGRRRVHAARASRAGRAVVVADAEVLGVAGAPPDGGSAASARRSCGCRAPQALRITAALNFAREVRLLVRPPDEAARRRPAAVAAP